MKQNSPIDGTIKRFSTYPEHPEDKIPKSWLVDRIDKNPATEGKNRTFHPFFLMGFWSPTKTTIEKMQSGDELWSFLSGGILSCRAGVAIIRNGVVVHAELRMMS